MLKRMTSIWKMEVPVRLVYVVLPDLFSTQPKRFAASRSSCVSCPNGHSVSTSHWHPRGPGSLDVTAVLQAGGSKRMAQSMGVYSAHPGPAQIALDTLAVAARLHRPFSTACEKPGIRAGAAPQLAQQKDQVVRNRYLTA